MTQAQRPTPAAAGIGADGEIGLLRELLAIERARLESALALERSRKIVFPETTVILRDVERLLGKIRAYETGTATKGTGLMDGLVTGDELLQAVRPS